MDTDKDLSAETESATSETKEQEVKISDEQAAQEAFKEELSRYRDGVEKMRNTSIDLFEKQLIYVAGGTIAGSVYIIDKFLSGVQHGFVWVLISWLLWGGTIVVNLLSHSRAMVLYNRTLGEITNNGYDPEAADKRAKKIGHYNLSSLALYFLGVIAFIIFFVINLTQMNKPVTKENTKIEIIDPYHRTIEQKLDSIQQEIQTLKLIDMPTSKPKGGGTKGAVPAPAPKPVSPGGGKPKS